MIEDFGRVEKMN